MAVLPSPSNTSQPEAQGFEANLDDLSTDCLLIDEYHQIVMIGAVADIVGATDIDATTQEFITERLAAESYPVGSGERLRNALLRLRSLLIDEARGNLRSLYPAPVSIMNINYSA